MIRSFSLPNAVQFRVFKARDLCWRLVLFPLLFTSLPLVQSAAQERRPEALPVQQVRGQHGMVVSASRHASLAGAQVLHEGGNAVDASVAVALALAVTWPEAGNLGGGGFMLVQPATGDAVCIDYRECAPLSAKANMYAPGESTYTHRAVGVPGTPAGLALAHERFGKLPWRRLVEPAIELARDGFEVDVHLAKSLNEILSKPDVLEGETYAQLRAVYGHPQGRAWTSGDRLVLPELAKTLELIADQGATAFYQGEIAQQIVEEMRRGKGEIALRDLAEYQAHLRTPVRGQYREYEILGPPLPSSGGTCLILALEMLEPLELRQYERFSATSLHYTAEVMRRVYRERAAVMGDPQFTPVRNDLLDPEYAASLAATIDPLYATPSVELAGEIPLLSESPQTTHFSVIDRQGMAVANTYTLEASYGSRIVVGGAGFLLNNAMGDFNWYLGQTDRRGRIGTEANRIAPRKRMLSSQTPIVVRRDGKVVLVTGSPGGRSIINTVLMIVLNRLEWRLSPGDSIQAARMHHQWLPDELVLERSQPGPDSWVADQLRTFGHRVIWRSGAQGSAHSIFVDEATGERIGVSDWRRGGWAAASP